MIAPPIHAIKSTDVVACFKTCCLYSVPGTYFLKFAISSRVLRRPMYTCRRLRAFEGVFCDLVHTFVQLCHLSICSLSIPCKCCRLPGRRFREWRQLQERRTNDTAKACTIFKSAFDRLSRLFNRSPEVCDNGNISQNTQERLSAAPFWHTRSCLATSVPCSRSLFCAYERQKYEKRSMAEHASLHESRQ